MKNVFTDINIKQVKFYDKLVACLRGFTQHEFRPIAAKYQKRFKTWREAYLASERSLREAKEKSNYVEHKQCILDREMKDWLDSQITI